MSGSGGGGRPGVVAALAMTVIACAKNPGPQAGPAPGSASVSRALTADDPDLPQIVIAAARAASQTTGTPAQFGGVFINGRSIRSLGQAVAAETQMPFVEVTPGKVPFAICTAGTACPEAERARALTTITFTTVTVSGDSAYVAGTATSVARGILPACYALARWGDRQWAIATATLGPTGKRCGK